MITRGKTMAEEPCQISPGEAPQAPEPSIDVAMGEIQSLIEQQRATVREFRSGSGDVRWMLWLCLALFFPVIGVYFVFSADEADVATQFVQVVGLVVAGWGIVRVLRAPPDSRVRKQAALHVPLFLIFFLFYGQLLVSSVSLRYAPTLIDFFLESPSRLRRK